MGELARIETPTGVTSYDAMCKAIAVCHSSDEAKTLRDQAEALRVYALQAKNIEAERQAAEIRIRAERRWGQIYKPGDKANGKRTDLLAQGKQVKDSKTLNEMNVSFAQSSRWQKLADVPDKEFEKALNKAGANGVPTTIGVIRNAGNTIDHDDVPSDPLAGKALWIWGRMGQLSDTISQVTPKACADRCDELMRDELRQRLPTVITWLKKLNEELK